MQLQIKHFFVVALQNHDEHKRAGGVAGNGPGHVERKKRNRNSLPPIHPRLLCRPHRPIFIAHRSAASGRPRNFNARFN